MKTKKSSEIQIDQQVSQRTKVADYSSKKKINGVKVIELKHHASEDGLFLELARIKDEGSIDVLPDFKIRQLSLSILDPGTIKAWHLHYLQNDVWFVPPNNKLLVGLYDTRRKSQTNNVVQRLTLGSHLSSLLFIPKGVAHGCSNCTNDPGALFYMTDVQFNKNKPDEYRLPWDLLGKGFWEIKKE